MSGFRYCLALGLTLIPACRSDGPASPSAPVGGGPAVTDRGSYLQVWHHEPDGRWRFAREIWNSAAPPAGASPRP
jgi:ketosteroid isomerase-like protein